MIIQARDGSHGIELHVRQNAPCQRLGHERPRRSRVEQGVPGNRPALARDEQVSGSDGEWKFDNVSVRAECRWVEINCGGSSASRSIREPHARAPTKNIEPENAHDRAPVGGRQ
jgi:hypothetical protein